MAKQKGYYICYFCITEDSMIVCEHCHLFPFMYCLFQVVIHTWFQFYEYGRSGNPTRDCLEKCLASIENAKFGELMVLINKLSHFYSKLIFILVLTQVSSSKTETNINISKVYEDNDQIMGNITSEDTEHRNVTIQI